VKLQMTISEDLAEFVLSIKWQDLDPNVVREARSTFFNWLGCAIGGSAHHSVGLALTALAPFAGPPQATVIGRRTRSDIFTASLINCTSSSVDSFDDTHADMIVHPTGPVASALMAVAETQKIAGREFLAALILGIEVECRLARALVVSPASCKVGWYLTGLTGGIGAAAAAGRVLGLSAQQLVWAMGIASSQAAGHRAIHASMTSALVPAQASQTGLRAAYLARCGFDSSTHYIEHPNGFLSLFAETADETAVLKDLGYNFEIIANNYKPFPCGIVLHAAVDASLTIARSNRLVAANVERIAVRVHPNALILGNRPDPETDLQATVSLHHWVASALVGHHGVEVNRPSLINDPAIIDLRRRIVPMADERLTPDAAAVAVTMKSGQVLEADVAHCLGSRERPMSAGDLTEKFNSQCRGVIDNARAIELANACARLENVDDVGQLARMAD
jgi:2-methylcitrate dehydratase PrpD